MLDVALKEWAVVCDLLLEGRLSLLLRKGGIHESGGPGVFELEHRRFALFPSWAHQKPAMIKSDWCSVVEPGQEPRQITFHGIGEAARIWPVTGRSQIDVLDDIHCWTAEQVDMRFSYKPDRPLFLVAVRASRLRVAKTVTNHAEYSGCRSWVPLRPGDHVDDAAAQPAVTDAEFDEMLTRIDAVII